MNKTHHQENSCFIPAPSGSALILFSLLSFFFMKGCFVSNSVPTTPVSAEIEKENDNTNSNPGIPTLSVKYTVKELHFSWNAVAEATYYRVLENPDGISGFSPISPNISSTSYIHEIKSRSSGWNNARYQLEACNSSLKCTASPIVDVKQSILAGIAPVTASNGKLNDYFGLTVALSNDGSTLVVGAPGEDSSATGVNGDESTEKQLQSGAAYVFEYKDNKWVQHTYLKASDSTQNSKFGYSLALSSDGNTLAIGAPEGHNEQSGMVYIFTRSNNQWREQASLRAVRTETGDLFGSAVALTGDGNTLVIGAPGEDSGITDTESDNSTADSGAAYVWSLGSNGQWKQQQYIKPDNITRFGEFGKTTVISSNGKTLVISADKGAATDNRGTGAIFVFSYQPGEGQWLNQQLIKTTSPTRESRFGASIALSSDGNTLAAGARQESGDNDEHSGAVYVFGKTPTGQWMKQGNLRAPNASSHDEFGSSLAFSRDASLLAVGAPFEDSMATGLNGDQRRDECCNSGSVYLYTQTDDQQWKQIAYIKPTEDSEDSNERLFGEFGTSIALSSDNSTLAVGAPHLGSLLLLTGEILETLSAPKGDGVVYLYSLPAMLN